MRVRKDSCLASHSYRLPHAEKVNRKYAGSREITRLTFLKIKWSKKEDMETKNMT